MKTDLSVTINGVNLKNPIIAASGTFGFGKEYNDLYDVGCLGGICSKGLTLKPRDGNDGIRVYETTSGLMNSVGLQNPGIDCFILHELPEMKKYNTAIIANIGGNSIEEYVQGVQRLSETNVDMIELNISCPNVKCGGMAFGIRTDVACEVVGAVRQVCTKPLTVKLSPNAENIVEMALACEKAGADSLSLVNTFLAMAVDVQHRKPIFNNVYAGLSGPAIKPIALRMVHAVCRQVKIPVIGIGGITSAEDVLSFIMAGATAVQIGTANFINPLAGSEIVRDLKFRCEHEGIRSMREIRGIL